MLFFIKFKNNNNNNENIFPKKKYIIGICIYPIYVFTQKLKTY